jgi:hypothetical protein
MDRLCHHRPVPLNAADAARKTKLAGASVPAIVDATPDGHAAFEAVRGGPIPDAVSADHDWILRYAVDRGALDAALRAVARALASPGTLWIAYPKGTSKRQTDLTRDAGWDFVMDTDLMWLSLVAIDDAWSAFSLGRYKPGEARQTFR